VNFWRRRFLRRGPILRRRADYFLRRLLDILDGQVARRQNRVTAFGASTIPPRPLCGHGPLYWGSWSTIPSAAALPTSSWQRSPLPAPSWSVTRAPAPSLLSRCARSALMERPERLVLLIIGGLVNRMGPVLWSSPFVSTLTVIHPHLFHLARNPRRPRPPRIRLSLSSRRVQSPSARKTQQKVRLDFFPILMYTDSRR